MRRREINSYPIAERLTGRCRARQYFPSLRQRQAVAPELKSWPI